MKKHLSLLIAFLTVQQLCALSSFKEIRRNLLLVNQRLTKVQKATLHGTIWATHFATDDAPKTDAALCSTLLNLGTQIPLIIPQS